MRSLKKPKSRATEFQIYVKRNSAITDTENLVDFTEHRLAALAKKERKSGDIQKCTAYLRLLTSYLDGKVAIAWKDGEPKFLNVV